MPIKIPAGKSVYFGGRRLIGEIPDPLAASMPPGIKAALEAKRKAKPKPTGTAGTSDGQS